MIVFVGPPGSGKGTQAKLLAQSLDCPLLSIGEHLRAYPTAETEEIMSRGRLVPDRTVQDLLSKMVKTVAPDKEAVLDGFPRNQRQAEWLIQQSKAGRFRLTAIVQLLLSEATAKVRLSARGRADDNVDAVARRFKEYNQTLPSILAVFETAKMPIIEVAGEGELSDIHQSIVKRLAIKRR